MIIYGFTMQGKPEELPKEVAAWLLERNSLYPNIDFTVDCWEPSLAEKAKREEEAKKYSRIFVKAQSMGWGISLVIFPYLSQHWTVKIIGLVNDQGEILDPGSPEYMQGHMLPPKLRFEIAGVPAPKLLEMYDHKLGLPRKEDEPALETPEMMISFPPGLRWTSEVSMTGEEFNRLLSNPETKVEAERAIWEKDWDALKRLKEQNG